ncbi:hypothetical protein [Pedobacter sp. Hv1]|nr:hypothetical protein [Pedobacter sp. Hv1]
MELNKLAYLIDLYLHDHDSQTNTFYIVCINNVVLMGRSRMDEVLIKHQ